jgi:hypothetical protein
MNALRGVSIFLLVIATILGIVALFLNIAVHSGLNDDQKILLSQLRAKNLQQCNETLLILEMLSSVNQTPIDTMRVPQLKECEEYVRVRNPQLMNASDVRLTELQNFNTLVVVPSLASLTPLLELAAEELETVATAFNRTGQIDIYQNGTVGIFDYSIRSITLVGYQHYYVDLPKIDGLVQVTMNMTGELLLDDWMPAIGTGFANCTRNDLILDRQQEKIMTVPMPIMFDSRTSNGTNVLLVGNANVLAGSFVGIADDVHLSF